MPHISTAEPDGSAVKAFRERAGLTQEDLSKLLKRHPQTISDVESGRRPVSVILIGQIARVLKVQPELLIKSEAA